MISTAFASLISSLTPHPVEITVELSHSRGIFSVLYRPTDIYNSVCYFHIRLICFA